MIDLRRIVVGLVSVVIATAAVAQEHPGRGGGEHPGRPEQGGGGPAHRRPRRAVAVAGRRRDRSTASRRRAASSTTRRPPARSRCSINPASARRRCSTRPMWRKPTTRRARPVTFVFNGGPGAASAFLNLGLVGPRIAEFGMAGHDGASVHLIDNPDTWLAFTDLVLIDPVGTGWSRAAKPDGGSAFWSVHARRRIDGESDRALRRQERPRQFAEIHPRRKLRRLPRRQGGARAAERAGHVDLRHSDGLAACSKAHSSSAATDSRSAPRCNCRRSPQPSSSVRAPSATDALAQAEHFALTDYLTTLAGPPLQGRRGEEFLCARRPNDRPAGGRRRPVARLYRRRLRQKSRIAATTRSSATTMRPLRSDDPNPEVARRRAVPIRSSTAWCAPTAAHSSPMRATSSASRPT